MKLRLITALAPLALIAACAHDRTDYSQFTHSETKVQPAITHYADANRDGEVTKKEAQPYPALARSFDKYDSNKDGVLDAGEFARLEADSRDGLADRDRDRDRDGDRAKASGFRGHPLDPNDVGSQPGSTAERGRL